MATPFSRRITAPMRTLSSGCRLLMILDTEGPWENAAEAVGHWGEDRWDAISERSDRARRRSLYTEARERSRLDWGIAATRRTSRWSLRSVRAGSLLVAGIAAQVTAGAMLLVEGAVGLVGLAAVNTIGAPLWAAAGVAEATAATTRTAHHFRSLPNRSGGRGVG